MGGEGDGALVWHDNLEPVLRVGVAATLVAQVALLHVAALYLIGAFPRVVRLRVVDVGSRCVGIPHKEVATLSGTVGGLSGESNLVDTRRHIVDGERRTARRSHRQQLVALYGMQGDARDAHVA